MKAFYDEKPSILEPVGNGSYRYRYNIEEETIENGFEDGNTRTDWKCDEVIVWSPISSNKITEVVITDKWDSNYEQKLVNEYNAAKLGLYTDETEIKKHIEKYTEYLTERANLKALVDSDCEKLGIK